MKSKDKFCGRYQVPFEFTATPLPWSAARPTLVPEALYPAKAGMAPR